MKTKTDRTKAKYSCPDWDRREGHVRTFRNPVVGVVETPHGQLLQGQHMVVLCANGLHLGREEDGQLPG